MQFMEGIPISRKQSDSQVRDKYAKFKSPQMVPSRISTERMMGHLINRSLAQSQKSKIENLVKKARHQRYGIVSKLSRTRNSSSKDLASLKGDVHRASAEEKAWQEMQERALANLARQVRTKGGANKI